MKIVEYDVEYYEVKEVKEPGILWGEWVEYENVRKIQNPYETKTSLIRIIIEDFFYIKLNIVCSISGPRKRKKLSVKEYFKESNIDEPFVLKREGRAGQIIIPSETPFRFIPLHVFLTEEERRGFEWWIFGDKLYMVKNDKNYGSDKIHLLIFEHIDKERKKFEGLKEKYLTPTSKGGKDTEQDYRKIAEDVRIFVWRRDGGKCVKCGSREKLEYDHIIPVSKGGSNTARNVELLCEKCNREKSNSIG